MVSNSDSIEVVLPKFINFIEKLPLVAHNVEFDYSFISHNYEIIFNKSFKRKKSCTMKLYRKYYKEMYDEKPDSAKLSACVFDLLSQEDNKVYSAGAHRALTDATMVYKIYEKIK
ncbi:DNA polymerase III subunit epsilon [compost metagenome]